MAARRPPRPMCRDHLALRSQNWPVIGPCTAKLSVQLARIELDFAAHPRLRPGPTATAGMEVNGYVRETGTAVECHGGAGHAGPCPGLPQRHRRRLPAACCAGRDVAGAG